MALTLQEYAAIFKKLRELASSETDPDIKAVLEDTLDLLDRQGRKTKMLRARDVLQDTTKPKAARLKAARYLQALLLRLIG